MNATAMQRALAAKGFDPGPADGVAGKDTFSALFRYMAGWAIGDRAKVLGQSAAKHLPAYRVDAPLRLSHWFSEWCHESAGFRLFEENLNYSAERLMVVWPKRFPNMTIARAYARNPEALANLVYGTRMGNDQPGDGYLFRGRGCGLTGRENYSACSTRTGLPLIERPDLAADPANFVHIACDYWGQHCLNTLADNDDLRGITKAINGGFVGIEERQRLLTKAKEVCLA